MIGSRPIELTLLGWSVLLFVAHMILQGASALREQGFLFNAGPRDDPPPLGPFAARAQRTFDNFKETYPAFIALALGLALTGRTGGVAAIGAWIWFLGRIAYIPLYVFGVPWVRTICWGTATTGLILMLIRFLG